MFLGSFSALIARTFVLSDCGLPITPLLSNKGAPVNPAIHPRFHSISLVGRVTELYVRHHEILSRCYPRFDSSEPPDAWCFLFVGDSHALAARRLAAVHRRPGLSRCFEHAWSSRFQLLRPTDVGQHGCCAVRNSGVPACYPLETVCALLRFVCVGVSRLLGPHAPGTASISHVVVGLAHCSRTRSLQ